MLWRISRRFVAQQTVSGHLLPPGRPPGHHGGPKQTFQIYLPGCGIISLATEGILSPWANPRLCLVTALAAAVVAANRDADALLVQSRAITPSSIPSNGDSLFTRLTRRLQADGACAADLSGDGVIGTDDLLYMLAVFGRDLVGCDQPFFVCDGVVAVGPRQVPGCTWVGDGAGIASANLEPSRGKFALPPHDAAQPEHHTINTQGSTPSTHRVPLHHTIN